MDDWLSLRLRLAAAAVLLATPCRPLIAQSQALVFIEGFRVHDSLSLIAAESLRSELPRHLAQRGPAVMSTRDIDERFAAGEPDDFGVAWTWDDVLTVARMYRCRVIVDIEAAEVAQRIRLRATLVDRSNPVRRHVSEVKSESFREGVVLLARRVAGDTMLRNP